MKFIHAVVTLSAFLFLISTSSFATPVDLSNFADYNQDGGVSINASTGVIELYETSAPAQYAYDSSFYVAADDSTLSFDYAFSLGEEDYFDYLNLEIDFVEVFYTETPGAGHVSVDLTSYADSVVDLSWNLYWSLDFAMGAAAKIYNIDIASSDPVPEPSTLLLLGAGLAGLFAMRRKQNR